jgi:hypothetical protein
VAVVQHYAWIFPATMAGVALVLIVIGAVPALSAAQALKKKGDALKAKAADPLVDPARMQRAMARINADIARLPALIDRSRAAMLTIQTGLRDLRMPQAITAIRLAAAAVAALRY